MRFINVINGMVIGESITETQIRFAFPNCALPKDLQTCTYLNENNWFAMEEVPPPVIDPVTQFVVEQTPSFDGTNWRQNWSIETKPESETVIDIEIIKKDAYAHFDSLIDEFIDAKAKSLGYRSTDSICGYVTSSIPKVHGEAVAFIAWRDQIWTICLQVIADVNAGTRGIPDETEFLSLMPELVV